jgi:phosphate/sulfate permease
VDRFLYAIRTNPVRLYSVAVALVALVAFYVPGLPVALVLGLVGAILGVGEAVRSQVTPNERVAITRANLVRAIVNADADAEAGR